MNNKFLIKYIDELILEHRAILSEGKLDKAKEYLKAIGLNDLQIKNAENLFKNQLPIFAKYWQIRIYNISTDQPVEPFLKLMRESFNKPASTEALDSNIYKFCLILRDEDNRPMKDNINDLLNTNNDYSMIYAVRQWNYIRDWRDAPNQPTPNLRPLSWKEAFDKAFEWHDQLERNGSGIIRNETGKIILKFPNGYYWIDLQSNFCEDEKQAMGHCANTSADTLLSLRKPANPNNPNPEPIMTVAYNYDHSYTQCKGKGNDKPKKEYWKYFLALIKELEINEFNPEYGDGDSDLTFNDFTVRELYDVGTINIDNLVSRIEFRDEITEDDIKLLHDLYTTIEGGKKYTLIDELQSPYNIRTLMVFVKTYPEEYKLLSKIDGYFWDKASLANTSRCSMLSVNNKIIFYGYLPSAHPRFSGELSKRILNLVRYSENVPYRIPFNNLIKSYIDREGWKNYELELIYDTQQMASCVKITIPLKNYAYDYLSNNNYVPTERLVHILSISNIESNELWKRL